MIGEVGTAGLTHRAAAAKAGVPLGSTTYYFSDLDELLEAALRTVAERNVERLRTGRPRYPSTRTSAWRSRNSLSCWPPSTARTACRPTNSTVPPSATRRFAPRARHGKSGFESQVDSTTAKALTAMFDGLLYQALVSPLPPARDDIESIPRRLLG